MQHTHKRLKMACYTGNITMSVVGNLSPLLFLTFRNTYHISYSLLGLLVFINFFSQLGVDLVFSFFSHKFNIPRTVRLMPVIAIFGFALFALAPELFPGNVYLGLALGTVIFSIASGLAEVLLSPIIAEIPAENPDREMSKLHSVYAWGVVAVVVFSTLFLLGVGYQNWQWLVCVLALIPLLSAILFSGAEIPQMKTPERVAGAVHFLKNKAVWLCVIGIFLGGAAECTMAQWASSYLERALGIPKVWGDVLGVALFAAALGLGRTMYAQRGKQPTRVLLLGAIGAFVCYLVAAFSPFAVVGLLGCACTGFCVSMLWPGSLIISSEKFPNGGVLIFALMASGGDMGAALGPQLVGAVTDMVLVSDGCMSLAGKLHLGIEQLAMKTGLLVGAVFPLLAIAVYARMHHKQKLQTKKSE
jgi:fucose permease